PGEDERLAQARELLTRLQPLSALVEQVQPRDPSLAEWLRRHPYLYLEDPAEAEAFRQSWAGLVVPEAAPAAAEGPPEPARAEGGLPAAPQGTPGQTAPAVTPAEEGPGGG
ncbi:MAG TPA: hypothetical protein VNO81_04860, partial [Candidatus Nitrosotenuis sp.]|nr:hypothetical protein [Candidatus Nitrosotenuis sp.]